MTRTILFLLAIILFPCSFFAQVIYLKYDPSCMDRLEYTSGYSTAPYISYSFNLAGNKKAILDIGQEEPKWVKEVPGKVISCSSLPVDKSLVQQINDEKVKLYIVQESPTHYNVSPVDKAVYYQVFGNSLEFLASDADFVMHTDNLVSGINLAQPTSKMEVYLDGTLRMQCANAYILKKKENFNSVNYKEYVILPETGIVEKRSFSASGTASDANALKLDKINNEAYKDVLSRLCDRIQATYYDGSTAVPSSYDATTSTQPTAVPASYASDPCAPSTVEGLHVVQKGETMYSISKRYGATLDQLRAWNKLENANVISLCQKLYVKEPSTVSTTTGSTASAEKSTKASATEGYWITAPEVHVVKPAETVAGLAYTYGYTEERFRKMNGLGTAEGIVPGQRLRTTDCVCPTLESTTKDKPLPYNLEAEKIVTEANKEDVYFRPVKIHQVKANETLFSIAKLYDTTVERLMELNDLKKGEGVKPEQKIYVQ